MTKFKFHKCFIQNDALSYLHSTLILLFFCRTLMNLFSGLLKQTLSKKVEGFDEKIFPCFYGYFFASVIQYLIFVA